MLIHLYAERNALIKNICFFNINKNKNIESEIMRKKYTDIFGLLYSRYSLYISFSFLQTSHLSFENKST